jgi:hypothetical protein
MRGFPEAYAKFENKPKHFIVDGNHAAVISHISALAMKFQDQPIEAEAVLYIENDNGKIKYAANFHDSKPFKPFLKQIGAE